MDENYGQPGKVRETRNRPAMLLGLLLAATLVLAAVRSGAFDAEGPVGLTANPCPETGNSSFAVWLDAASGRADRQRQRDWGNLCSYRSANAALAGKPPARAVLIGDSTTARWQWADPGLFAANIVNRGIGGQISTQVLVRFYQDAAALRPRAIHLMAGLNDIGGLRGPTTEENLRNNIRAMADIAHANQIPLILGSVTPVLQSEAQPRREPIGETVAFNRWLRGFAGERGLVFADYHAVLAETSGELKAGFSLDGVHLNQAAYAAMRPVLERALRQAEAGPAATAKGRTP